LNHFGAGAELPLVRHLQARHAGVLAVAAAVGAFTAAGPAAADVSVSPPSVLQGSGQNLYFKVTNTAHSAITRVKLVLPKDTPVAEVYPLSADNWAPEIATQKLSTPLETIHGGTPVDVTAKDITWVAVAGKAIPPGGSAELGVAIGPLPTLSEMAFTVLPTYADGKPGPVEAPAVLKLTPATAEEIAADHAGHDAPKPEGGSGAITDPEAAAFEAIVAQADQGPSAWTIAGWVVAALIAIGAAIALVRTRRRALPRPAGEPEDTDGDEGEKEPVGAGAGKANGWRYQDGPQ
jgi:hypothetical protein